MLDDIGNAEAAADFDQLAARDDHLFLRRDRSEEQQRSGSVVVCQDRRFTSEERLAERRQVLVARAALAAIEIEFEIRVSAHDLLRRLPNRMVDRGTAEVGVDDDAGGVDDGAESRGCRRHQHGARRGEGVLLIKWRLHFA